MYSMCMGMLHAHRPPLTRGQVRCCSDNKPPENERWLKVGGCSVWAASDASWECAGKDGQNYKTFAQAEAICRRQALSARLCTIVEIEDGCTSGTGCQLDFALVWASTPA